MDGSVDRRIRSLVVVVCAIAVVACPLPAFADPVIASVSVSPIADSVATVTWSTDVPATTQLEFGTDPSYGTLTPPDTLLSNVHSVPLTGLANNTLYHFRVRSQDASGGLAVSDDLTFTTRNYATINLSSPATLSSPNTRYVLTQNLTGVVGSCFVVTADNITIDGGGYTISGNGVSDAGADSGVESKNRSLVVVTNLTISNFRDGVYFWKTSNSFVHNATLSSNETTGIYLFESLGDYLLANVAQSNWQGILLTGSRNNRVHGNETTLNSQAGIYLEPGIGYSNDNRVSGNNASYNGAAGVSFPRGIYLDVSARNVVDGNTASGNGTGAGDGNGIGIMTEDSAEDNLYLNNTANDNGWAGLYVESDSDRNQIIGNTFHSNGLYGIEFRSSGDCTVSNNVLSNNGIGIKFYDSNGNRMVANTINASVRNAMYFYYAAGNTVTGGTIDGSQEDAVIFLEGGANNTLQALSVTNTDPGFVDMRWGDPSVDGNTFIDMQVGSYSIAGIGSRVGISRSALGSIAFLAPIIGSGPSLSNEVEIGLNRAWINPMNPGVNKSAAIVLSGLDSFLSPTVFRNGSVCPAGLFSNFSFLGGAASFDVSTGGTYSVGESPAPDLISIVVTPSSASLLTGQAQQFTAQGYDQYGAPFAATFGWSATGGTIDAEGLYTSPAAAGIYLVTATSGSVSGSATATVTLPTLSITTTSLTGCPTGVFCSRTIAASGGTGSGYAWSLASGTLPPGLTLAASGTPSTTLAGYPQTVGTFTFAVRVTDSASNTATQSFTMGITQGSLAITTPSLANGSVGVSYSQTITASGGSGQVPFWSISAGTPPPGLTLSAAGGTSATFSGTPTTAGTYTFTVRAFDYGAYTWAYRTYTMTVAPTSLLVVTTTSVANAPKGLSCSRTISAAGGSGAGYVWTLASGTLPPGLTLGGSGTPSTTLTGIPSTLGTYTFAVRVTDSASNTATRSYTMTVTQPLSITTISNLGTVSAGSWSSRTITANGGSSVGYAWSLASGALPPGMTMPATGTPSMMISGTSSTAGAYSFTLLVTDSLGYTATKMFTLTVGDGGSGAAAE